ncbi:MAG: T9SS type A sorting domain-containing protein [Saprospiraceae bacterium]|nr:T9SS type A sorting domain-containing protein [Saprospiraceae bacterium]
MTNEFALRQVGSVSPLFTKNCTSLFSFFEVLRLWTLCLVALIPFTIIGQNTSFCGYYRAIPPNGSNPDSLIYDRFGNAFDLEDLIPASSASVNPAPDCSTGYFNVTWVGGPPQDAQLVTCEVLSYVSSVVQQRQGQNDCGILPLESVEIQVGWISFSNPDPSVAAQLGMDINQFPLPSDWGAVGSPFYTNAPKDNTCNDVIPERAFIKINGGRILGSSGVVDGRILLNSDFLWNYDPLATTFLGADLYTASLHEMMHILGFSSRMGFSNNPTTTGAFTLWDQTLRIGDYDPVNGITIANDAITNPSGCTRNCWEMTAGLGNAAINSCVGNALDIIVGDAGLAPISGDPSINPNPSTLEEAAPLLNMLTHLSTDCGNQNVPYVMRPVYNPGEYQRTLTSAEQQILCALGYSVPAINCDGCYVIARRDGQLDPNSECCYKTFHVCVGESIEILNSELLCNDLSNDGQATITDVWHQPLNLTDPGAVMSVDANMAGTGWIITVPPNIRNYKTPYMVLYTITGCDCRQHNGTIRLFIDHYCPTSEFTEDICDNLLRDGGFEEATDNSYNIGNPLNPTDGLGGWPILFPGNIWAATPDMYYSNGNHFLGLTNFAQSSPFPNQEAINLEMQKCIKPGCELSLNLDLSYQIAEGVVIPSLQVWGSKSRPCPATIVNPVPIALNCGVQTNCAPTNAFDPVCLFTVPAQNALNSIDDPNFLNSTTYTWINTTNEDVCFLTFVNPLVTASKTTIFMDNILAEIRCEPEITCNVQPVEACEGEAASLTFTICAPEVPEYVDFTTINPILTLPPGWTLVGNDPEPFDLTEGQCMDVTLQVQMPAGTPEGTTVNIVLDGTASGLCTEVGWSCEAEVEVIHCDPCPCTEANTINIVAGENGTLYSTLEATHNFDQNDDGIINATEHNGCIAISGTLILDQDLTITSCPNIRMQPCSEIVVNAFRHLTMEYNNIYGCEAMWRNIAVESYGRLTFRFNTIADAQHALLVKPAPPFSGLTPTQIDVQHNRFERDHIGLYIPGNGGGLFGGNVWQTPFFGNVMECKGANNTLGNLLPPCDAGLPNYDQQNGYAGVAILGSNFDVGAAAGIRNQFVNLRNGVIAENVFLDVQRSDFENMIGFMDTQQPGFASSTGVGVAASGGIVDVTECTFDWAGHAVNHHQGLLTFKNSQTDHVRIGLEFRRPFAVDMAENDQIGFLRYGVRGWNPQSTTWLGKYVFDNNVFQTQDNQLETSSDYGNAIQLTNGSVKTSLAALSPQITRNNVTLNDYVYGILIDRIGGWQIADNNFTINMPQNPPLGGIGNYGLSLYNSDDNYLYGNTAFCSVVQAAYGTVGFGNSMSTGNRYCCNTTDGTDMGVTFLGSCQGTQLRQTDFFNHKNSLLLHGKTIIGRQPEQVTGTNSNRFNAGSGTAQHFGLDLIIDLSRFYVTNQSTPHYPELVSTPYAMPSDWFVINGAPANACSTDPACPPLQYPDGERSEIEATDLALVSHFFDTLAEAAMLHWELARDLYARLKAYPELSGQSAQIDSFYYTTDAGGAIKSFYDAEQLARTVDDTPEAILLPVQFLQDTIEAIETASAAILSALPIATNRADSLALYWEAEEERGRLVVPQNALSQVRISLDSLRQARAQTVLPVINSLPEADLLQSNLKAVWRIYIEMCAEGVTQLDEDQFDEIADIAHQCPLTGGRAVLAARSLYRTKIAKHFDDDILCASSGARQSIVQRSGVLGHIQVRPNPAVDRISIIIPSGIGKSASVQLLDMAGRVILETETRVTGEVLDLNVSPLKSGLYLCRVSVAERQFEPVKISIIR